MNNNNVVGNPKRRQVKEKKDVWNYVKVKWNGYLDDHVVKVSSDMISWYIIELLMITRVVTS